MCSNTHGETCPRCGATLSVEHIYQTIPAVTAYICYAEDCGYFWQDAFFEDGPNTREEWLNYE